MAKSSRLGASVSRIVVVTKSRFGVNVVGSDDFANDDDDDDNKPAFIEDVASRAEAATEGEACETVGWFRFAK